MLQASSSTAHSSGCSADIPFTTTRRSSFPRLQNKTCLVRVGTCILTHQVYYTLFCWRIYQKHARSFHWSDFSSSCRHISSAWTDALQTEFSTSENHPWDRRTLQLTGLDRKDADQRNVCAIRYSSFWTWQKREGRFSLLSIEANHKWACPIGSGSVVKPSWYSNCSAHSIKRQFKAATLCHTSSHLNASSLIWIFHTNKN